MHSETGIATLINSETVILIFNEDILMPKRDCNLVIAFPNNLINGWTLNFRFTDKSTKEAKPLSSTTTFENEGANIIFTYYSWFGNGLENKEPHYIESVNKKTRIYIKVRTNATAILDTRNIHISIWKVFNDKL